MNRRDGFALALVAALVAVAFGGFWFTNKVPFARDLTYTFHPTHVFTAESLQAGRLPLWNPHACGGMSWLGQPQTGVFYPGNVVFWMFSFAGGLKLFSAGHFLLTALGGYLLVRLRKGGRGLALASALLWSLNGFWRARVEFPSLLAVLSWTPWAFLFLSPRVGRAALLALVLAFSLTAGYLPQVFWGAALLLLWAAVDSCPRATIFSAVAAGTTAVALSAAALGPALDSILRSARVGEGLDLSIATHYSLRPVHWLGLLWPRFSALPEWAFTGERYFWLGCFYVGAVGFALAIFAGRRLPVRERWAWALVGLFGAVLVLGKNAPVYPLLYRTVPFFRWVRYPSQHAFWMVAAALLVVARAAPFLRRGKILWLLAGLAAGELLWHGRGTLPVIPSAYFRDRPAWIETVQGNPDGRLFLTPRAVGVMTAEGRSWAETWVRLRGRLLNMATVPYHVRNVNPFGFGLATREAEKLLGGLYSRPSYAAAAGDLDRLGVRWVASPAPISAPELVLRGTAPWFLYERTGATGGVVFRSSSSTVAWRRSSDDVNRVEFFGPPAGSGLLSTSEMFDPGWRAYADGRRLAVANEEGLSMVETESPVERVTMLFRPRFFLFGVLAGVLAAAGALWGGGWMLRRFLEKAGPSSVGNDLL